MAALRFVTRPAYRLLVLRDADNDAAVGADEAIREIQTAVVATTGYEIYVNVAQDLLPVTALVQFCDSRPEVPGARDLPLEVPSGDLVLGSPTGEQFGLPPVEPGLYGVAVEHSGREEAVARRSEGLADPPLTEPVETYTFHLWRIADLDDEEG